MKTFGSNLKRKWYFSEIFFTQLCFDIYILCCKIIRSQIDFKLKVRTEFSLMYGENTNTIAIPIYRVLPYPVIHRILNLNFMHTRNLSADKDTMLVHKFPIIEY